MMRMFLTAAALIGLALAPAPVTAADPKLEGAWEGTLKVNDDISLRLIFRIAKGADGSYSATLDSPDEGAKGIKVDAVKLDKSNVTLSIKAIQATYEGKFNAEGTKIEGTYSVRGKSFPMVLSPAGPEAPAAKPDLIWEGKLDAGGGIQIRLVINMFKQKDGTFKATLDSPDQGASGIKIDKVTLDKETLSFTARLLQAQYSGKLNAEGTEAKGDFKQGPATIPLTLKKTEKVSEVKRTQMPKGPFPYQEIEVAYPNKAAEGVKLAGTLTLPKGDGPFPVVVLISGSGAQDRDETLLGHKPFLVLADHLTRRGIGVLRFDDRGTAKSTGDHNAATSADFATDVQAGVEYLKTRKDVDGKRIGLMGHSEGGLIAPMVAANNLDDIAFIVLLAGPGVPGDEILIEQSALIQKAMGAKPEAIAKNTVDAKKLYALMRTETDPAKLKVAIDAIVKESIAAMGEAERKALGENPELAASANLKKLQSPWFRYFLTYDPRPTLAKVKCPVLAINGELDLQVPPRQNLPVIEATLKAAGNSKVTIKELKGLNHLFQPTKTGAPSEYAAIEETFSPEALKVIGDWIVELK